MIFKLKTYCWLKIVFYVFHVFVCFLTSNFQFLILELGQFNFVCIKMNIRSNIFVFEHEDEKR